MSETLERLAVVENKVSAAHRRLDKNEKQTAESLKDISTELKELTAFMHKSRGMAIAMVSAATVLGTIVGTVLASLIPLLFPR